MLDFSFGLLARGKQNLSAGLEFISDFAPTYLWFLLSLTLVCCYGLGQEFLQSDQAIIAIVPVVVLLAVWFGFYAGKRYILPWLWLCLILLSLTFFSGFSSPQTKTGLSDLYFFSLLVWTISLDFILIIKPHWLIKTN